MTLRMLKLSALLALLCTGSTAIAEGSLSVTRKAELNVAPDQVWSLVGGFGDWHNWHPAVASTELTGDGKQPGDQRVLTLGNGAKIHETLEGWDGAAMRCNYTITESPLPVSNYHSTLSVEPAADGKSTVTWTSSFDAAGVSDEDAVNAIAGVYEAGLGALTEKYNK